MRRVLLLVIVSGCYVDMGLGGGTSGGSFHMSTGIAGHFGAKSSLRAGAGFAITGYSKMPGRDGFLVAFPALVGGDVALASGAKNQLSITAEANIPGPGWTQSYDPDELDRTVASRAYAGLGWRRRLFGKDGTEEGTSTLALGPEMFFTRPSGGPVNVEGGAALTWTVTVHAAAMSRFIDCMLSKSCED